MTEAYRTAELTNARKELETARSEMNRLKAKGWNSKARDAAEQVEVWGNKVAFLTCVKI